jgi:hypothetical protein
MLSAAVCLLFMQSVPVCTIEISFMDVETREIKVLEDSHITLIMNRVVFPIEQLTAHRHYNVVIQASNVAAQSVTSYGNLSQLFRYICSVEVWWCCMCYVGTHDVEVVSIKEMNGIIKIAVAYSNYSTAGGALFSLVYITEGDVDFSRSSLLALDRNTSYNHTLPFGLYPGHYKVYVYDIEHGGRLSNGVGYSAVFVNLVVANEGNYVDTFICKLIKSIFPRFFDWPRTK